MSEIDTYIEKYCTKHEISQEEAKQHVLVKEVAEYYENAQKGKISVVAGAEMGADCK